MYICWNNICIDGVSLRARINYEDAQHLQEWNYEIILR
jgi:hypothetical protein